MEVYNGYFIEEYQVAEAVSFGTMDTNEVTRIASDSTGASSSLNRIVGNAMGITRFVMLILIFVFIYKAIKMFKDKKPGKGTWYMVLTACCVFVDFSISIVKSFKPVIYLYPEEETEVEVKLKNKEKLTCTYPKYKDGWKVLAEPDGTLIDLENGREYYSLYWEGKNEVKHNLKEGFIVEGKDAEKFLEEKLDILGLTEREAQEFIIYWLPKLEENKYNFVRFETKEEIEEDMPLEISPKPDSVIRVMMAYRKIVGPFEVTEQKLETPERKGFTVVEWGGTII